MKEILTKKEAGLFLCQTNGRAIQIHTNKGVQDGSALDFGGNFIDDPILPSWGNFIDDPVCSSKNENSYEVNLFFSATIFEALIYSQHSTNYKRFGDLVERNLIEIRKVDSEFKIGGVLTKQDLTKLAEISRPLVSETEYIKIKVIDLKNLIPKTGRNRSSYF